MNIENFGDRSPGRDAGPDPDRAVLDVASLRDRCGGDPGFARELVEFFRDMMPDTLAGLRQARDDGDFEKVAAKAHDLGGAATTLGASTLARSAAQLERAEIERVFTDWVDLDRAFAAWMGGVP